MNLPGNANPEFVAWLNRQEPSVQDDINEKWKAAEAAKVLVRGHRSAEHGRLRFLMDYCRATYGYGG